MTFQDAVLEVCNQYNDDYRASEVMIEIKFGKVLLLLPFRVNIETDLEDQAGDPAISFGQVVLTDEIMELIEKES